jgi:serine/threonine protein kinase
MQKNIMSNALKTGEYKPNVKQLKENNKSEFDPIWEDMSKSNGFELKGVLGQGSFGTVMKAQCRESKNEYAIKLIEQPFKNEYSARQLLREIKILRKFTEMESNIYTTKIYDIIVSDDAIVR